MLRSALPPSRRERGKDDRRTRIVEATCALMREHELAELSVKMIAERALVSPATVYNLFGTKAAILVKVYERDLIAFERRVWEARSADAIERIFDAVSIAAERYRDDPRYCRAAMSARNAGLDQDMVLSAHRPRVDFWRGMAQCAIAERLLRPDANTERLGVLLIQVFTGALARWMSDLICADELELETSYGFAVVLLAFATRGARPRLLAKLGQFEQALEGEAAVGIGPPTAAAAR